MLGAGARPAKLRAPYVCRDKSGLEGSINATAVTRRAAVARPPRSVGWAVASPHFPCLSVPSGAFSYPYVSSRKRRDVLRGLRAPLVL